MVCLTQFIDGLLSTTEKGGKRSGKGLEEECKMQIVAQRDGGEQVKEERRKQTWGRE